MLWSNWDLFYREGSSEYTITFATGACLVKIGKKDWEEKHTMIYEFRRSLTVLREIVLDSGKLFHLFENLFLLLWSSISGLSDRGRIIVWAVSRKLRYLAATSLSVSKQRAMSIFPTIQARTLTLEWACHPRLRTARGLSLRWCDCWGRWTNAYNTLLPPTDCFVKGTHPQGVDVVAIR